MALNVQTQCLAWMKVAADNFSTVLTKNQRNPRDYAPLITSFFYPFKRTFQGVLLILLTKCLFPGLLYF